VHKVLGLDLAATGVKAVAVEASFRTHELRGVRLIPLAPLPAPPAAAPSVIDPGAIDPSADLAAVAPPVPAAPPTWSERLRPALESLAADGWLQADQIVCALPAAQIASHLVSLPFGDPKRIDQTLKFEVEGLIPFDLEEVVFDWQVISRSASRTELLVAVARREDVAALLALLQSCGCDPQVVTFSALSLVNLYAPGHLPTGLPESAKGKAPANLPPAPVEALVDIGAERTNLVLAQGGQVLFARTLSTGGGDVTRAVARALGLPLDMAEEAKKGLDLAAENDPTVQVALERAASSLVREVRATLASHASRTKAPVERLRVCGGGSRLGGLLPFLSESLQLPVEALVLPEASSHPEPDQLPEAALALALALHGAGRATAPRLNFRKGPFAFTRDAGELRGRYGTVAVMAAVLLLLFGVSAFAKLSALESREAAIDQVLCDTTQKILGKCETDFRVALGRLKGRGSPAASVPNVSAVQLVQAVSELFPGGDDAVLGDIDVVDSNVRLRGDAKTFDAVENVVGSLQKNACFTEIKKSPLVKGKDGRIQFDLDASWTCGRPAEKKKAGS
jgi:general secretion pathway protein L